MEDRQLGQLLLMGIPGTELDPATAKRLAALQPGGFILFSRNIQSPTQLRQLIDDLRDLSEIEPIITIDQEGGRVSRLREIGHEPPNAVQLREKKDSRLIYRHGALTGQLLRLYGFNLDLCPVLDFSADEAADNSLRGRTYGRHAQEVLANAGVFNGQLRRQGIRSCGKHFPGYGGAEVDPHHELPVISRTLEEMEAEELTPYRTLLDELDSIMSCHAHYPAFDAATPGLPASLSPRVLTQFLRGQWGYRGLILTDDLDMGAILQGYSFEDCIRLACTAGNDLMMICHRVEMVERAKEALRDVPEMTLDDRLASIRRFKKRLPKPQDFSVEQHEILNQQIWDLRVDTLGEEQARQRSPEDGKRSPVELY
ncbi:MAG: glycoside hydrolase family 3 N-terminal domain-containing protein [Verrucomicrobiota bacterium]